MKTAKEQAKTIFWALMEATKIGEPMSVELTIIENGLKQYATQSNEPEGGEIEQIISEVEDIHPYKERGNADSYSDYNQGWSDACDVIEQRLKDNFSTPKPTELPSEGEITEMTDNALNHMLEQLSFDEEIGYRLGSKAAIAELINKENGKT